MHHSVHIKQNLLSDNQHFPSCIQNTLSYSARVLLFYAIFASKPRPSVPPQEAVKRARDCSSHRPGQWTKMSTRESCFPGMELSIKVVKKN
jgi:hypothetical protein